MPISTSAGLDVHYDVDDFTDPSTTPETILMLHGNCKSGAAWYDWVPQLVRHCCSIMVAGLALAAPLVVDRKSTRLNSSHQIISYAVFCLKKKKKIKKEIKKNKKKTKHTYKK